MQLLLPELTQPEVVLLLTSISLPLLRPEALVALLPRLESETLAHQFHARVHVCVSTWVDRHVSALTAEEGDGSEGSLRPLDTKSSGTVRVYAVYSGRSPPDSILYSLHSTTHVPKCVQQNTVVLTHGHPRAPM